MLSLFQDAASLREKIWVDTPIENIIPFKISYIKR